VGDDQLYPASISVGRPSILTLSAPTSQPTGTSSLSVTASATIGGQLVTQSAPYRCKSGISTTFLGRTGWMTRHKLRWWRIGYVSGEDDKGNITGCSEREQTSSDASGNFVITNLPAACVGPQLIAYQRADSHVSGGQIAGVNLSYTIVANQVTTSPFLSICRG